MLHTLTNSKISIIKKQKKQVKMAFYWKIKMEFGKNKNKRFHCEDWSIIIHFNKIDFTML